jgi:SAM-dependent methyltransferase
MTSATPAHEVYQHGHHASVVSNHAKRTADKDAAFFLPVLRPGMRLLDVGCGPGSITAGLAKRVAPGETIGIDASQSVIDTARSLRDPALGSLTFEVGSIYEPRFPPASFDAVFAHQVLQHLRRPVDALVQIGKLLKPGGVLGVRDADWGSMTFYPENEGMRRFLAMYYDLARRNGGEPNAGRHLRRWFREAGFADTQVTTSTTSYADAAATRDWANTYAERTLHSNLADKALEYGIATRAELESMAAAWRAWGDDPDALFCFSHTEVVAWKR